MPCCVLRVSGVDFDPDAFLAMSTWEADNVYRRGEKRSANGTNDRSGFSVLIGAEDSDFQQQAKDAVRFLQVERTELLRLRQTPGIDCVVVDFGVALGDTHVAIFFRMPIVLLTECSTANVELEVSVYQVESK